VTALDTAVFPTDRRPIRLAVCVYLSASPISVAAGKVLAVSRRDRPDDIGFPGGQVEEGEALAEAASRELCEETGLVVPPVALAPIYAAFSAPVHDGDAWWLATMLGLRQHSRLVPIPLDPFEVESGVRVRLAEPRELVAEDVSFRDWNERFFTSDIGRYLGGLV